MTTTEQTFSPGDRVQTPNGPATIKNILRTTATVVYDTPRKRRGASSVTAEPVRRTLLCRIES